MLLEGEPGRPTAIDHLGVELGSAEEVHAVIGDSAVYGTDSATGACCVT